MIVRMAEEVIVQSFYCHLVLKYVTALEVLRLISSFTPSSVVVGEALIQKNLGEPVNICSQRCDKMIS